MTDPESPTAFTVPSRTTPTWEVELLISGALTIALFQLPPLLESTFAQWIAMAPSSRIPIVLYGYIYSKIVLLALIGTFVLHIAARANWVAIVGVHTVFPSGPRWENLSAGPISRRIAQRIAGNVDEAIERADNRATLIFSYGILTAQFSFGILLMSLVAIAFSRLFALVMDERWALMIAALLLALPSLFFGSIDRIFGARIRDGGWFSRQIERGLQLATQLGLVRFAQPLLPMLITNIGGRRGNLMLVAVVTLVTGAALIDTMAKFNQLGWMRGAALPALTRSSGVNPLHYAALRDDLTRYSAVPFIPAELSEGPYLRLVVPYSAERHDRILAQSCAIEMTASAADSQRSGSPEEATMLETDAARRDSEAALMACFASLFDLRLDGLPLRNITLERFRDPFSGHDAGLAMIDVRALAAGRHELQIKRLPRAINSLRYTTDLSEPPDRIAFWR